MTTDLRSLRKQQGLSLREIAGRAGIDPGKLSRIERGLTEPRLGTVRRILRALDAQEQEYLVAGLVPRPSRAVSAGNGHGREPE